MDVEGEKKWFLFLGDSDRGGPYSMEELQSHVRQGVLSPADYVWSEGMPHWKRLAEADAWRARPVPAVAEVTAEDLSARLRLLRRARFGRWLRKLAVCAGVGVAACAGVFAWRLGADWLARRSRTVLPVFAGVSREEYRELRGARLEPLAEGGPSLALALSSEDVWAPTFYLATNLPDGAKVDVFLAGKPDSLVEQTSYFSGGTFEVTAGWVRTTPFREAEGRPVPRGEYRVAARLHAEAGVDATAALQDPPVGFLAAKTVFLGGARDASYEARLGAYHQKLREQAQMEITELREFYETLRAQVGRFDRGLQKQLDEASRQWAEPSFAAGLYYRRVYAAARAALDAVAVRRAARGGEEIAARAMSALERELRAVEGLPLTANGMPVR